MKWFAALTLLAGLFVKVEHVAAQPGSINLLPMYGRVKKSKAFRKADAEFLADCDHRFPSRPAAASYFAKRGWDYYYAHDYATAIKRYNQAWLLDSTNASAYWGFGVIEGTRHHQHEALRYFRTSLRLDSTNRKIAIDMAQALIERYEATQYTLDLDSAITQLQHYLIDKSDTKGTVDAYMRMAVAYFLRKDYPSSWQYVDLTTALDAEETRNWSFLAELQKAAPR